jgi:branched-chain amino acid transport system ATP-binding protein
MAAPSTTPLLSVRGLDVSYGRLPALRGIDLDVRAGSIVALLGSNGAGKSTLLRAVSGLLVPTRGAIEFDGQSIGGRQPSWLVRRGLVHAAERRPLFGDFTVEENLRVGAHSLPRPRVTQALEDAYRQFPILRERRWQRAATLSGGEQQMLVIARALMARPKLLLLDEPSLGLAPLVVRDIYAGVSRIAAERGLAVLVAEPNVDVALGIADHGCVLETGTLVMAGTAAELRASDDVRRSYLGEGVARA